MHKICFVVLIFFAVFSYDHNLIQTVSCKKYRVPNWAIKNVMNQNVNGEENWIFNWENKRYKLQDELWTVNFLTWIS